MPNGLRSLRRQANAGFDIVAGDGLISHDLVGGARALNLVAIALRLILGIGGVVLVLQAWPVALGAWQAQQADPVVGRLREGRPVSLPVSLEAIAALEAAVRIDPTAQRHLDLSELLAGAAGQTAWTVPDSQRLQWLQAAEIPSRNRPCPCPGARYRVAAPRCRAPGVAWFVTGGYVGVAHVDRDSAGHPAPVACPPQPDIAQLGVPEERGARACGCLCRHDVAGGFRSQMACRGRALGCRRIFPALFPARPAWRAERVDPMARARSAMSGQERSQTASGTNAETGDPAAPLPAVRRVGEAAFVSVFFACVVFTAIPMGANRDWAWSPIVVLVGVLAVWHALGLGIADGYRVRAAERWPLVLLIASFLIVTAVGFLQISPVVPPSWGAAVYAHAAMSLGRPISAIISLDADAGRATLMKIAGCAAIFAIARSICGDHRRARLFLLLLLASAVLVTSYALFMHATVGSCYVFGYAKGDSAAIAGRTNLCLLSGTFVSSNSYATYVGMAFVVALGLTFSRPHWHDRNVRKEGPADVLTHPAIASWLTGPRIVFLTAALYVLGGLLLSASRAGFVTTVLGALVLGLLLMRGRWPSRPALGWTLVATLVAASVLLLIAGGAFITKLSTLSDGDVAGRYRIWQVAVLALKTSPWAGWGLGSFSDIFAILQPPDIAKPNDKAHSTPLETLVELGLPAGICAFFLVVVPMTVCLRGALRRRTDRYYSCTAFAAALIAIGHSLIDFSLQIPAIAFTASALLGLGWAQAFGRRE